MSVRQQLREIPAPLRPFAAWFLFVRAVWSFVIFPALTIAFLVWGNELGRIIGLFLLLGTLALWIGWARGRAQSRVLRGRSWTREP